MSLWGIYSLKRQSQQLSPALSSACDFKSHFCKQYGPRSDSDLGPHCLPVCKNRFEKSARILSRRHKQVTFSDAVFLGALRVKKHIYLDTTLINRFVSHGVFFISRLSLSQGLSEILLGIRTSTYQICKN